MNRGNVSERRHEPPQVGVTSVILALEPAREHGRRRLWLPLVRRVREPFLERLAQRLPREPLVPSH